MGFFDDEDERQHEREDELEMNARFYRAEWNEAKKERTKLIAALRDIVSTAGPFDDRQRAPVLVSCAALRKASKLVAEYDERRLQARERKARLAVLQQLAVQRHAAARQPEEPVNTSLAVEAFRALPEGERTAALNVAFSDMLKGMPASSLHDLRRRVVAGSGKGLEMIDAEIERRSE